LSRKIETYRDLQEGEDPTKAEALTNELKNLLKTANAAPGSWYYRKADQTH
jgi:hypothetical protein